MDPEFEKAIQRNPHLGEYVRKFMQENNVDEPVFMVSLSSKDIDPDDVNLILPVGDPVFIHIYGTPELGEVRYYGVELELNDLEKKKYHAILNIRQSVNDGRMLVAISDQNSSNGTIVNNRDISFFRVCHGLLVDRAFCRFCIHR